MNSFDLIITLQDDCIFSERNATAGGHKALDYIPGGALLGAVAAKFYPTLPSQQAFDWFHAGKLRFGNAYPLTRDKQRTFPMPACWHQAKGEKPKTEDGRIDEQKVWRLDKRESGKLPDDKQPVQLRDGYIALNGNLAEANKSFRMKTGIDVDTGRAKKSALFGYDALQAGQHFYAQIRCDDSFSEADIQTIKDALSDKILLGRSRSAEYGRASVSIPSDALPALPSGNVANNKITLWLLSDLMALDNYGQPTLAPLPQELGLPDGKLVVAESFLRTRRYSTWNAHKRGYEMERQVINKGSVLVYQLGAPLTDEHLNMVAAGLGAERQAGLGQVWLNPPLLETEQPVWGTSAALSWHDQTELAEPRTKPALIKWLSKRQEQATEQETVQSKAKTLAKNYFALCKSARDLKGLDDPSIHVGPSQSQWGSVLAAAKRPCDLEAFLNAEGGSFKAKGEGWKDEFWDTNKSKGQEVTSFHTWFLGMVSEKTNKGNQDYYKPKDTRLVQHLVREIQSVLKEQKHKGGKA